jgi:hypothetical protein
MYAAQGDYIKAFESYDAAVNIDKDLYRASNARLKQMDAKYGTSKAQDLRGKMTDEEKTVLCTMKELKN